MDDLESRVEKFSIMELPGQPRSMHMGTSYLVNDLWREVKRLREDIVCMVKKAAGQNLEGYRELGERAAKAENERDRFKTNLFALLTSLQCNEIEDLMTKGAEHFAAVGAAITDGYTDKANECAHWKQLAEKVEKQHPDLTAGEFNRSER